MANPFDDIKKFAKQFEFYKAYSISEDLVKSITRSKSLLPNSSISEISNAISKAYTPEYRLISSLIAERMRVVTTVSSSIMPLFANRQLFENTLSIPRNVFEHLSTVIQQQHILTSHFQNVTKLIKSSYEKINPEIQLIASQMANVAEKSKAWSNDAKSNSDNIELKTENEFINKEDIQKIYELVKKDNIQFFTNSKNKTKRDLRNAMFEWIAILSLLLTIYQTILALNNKSISKEDLKILEQQLLSEIKNKTFIKHDERFTNRSCAVRVKPKLKSYCLCSLPANYHFTVLTIFKTWIYISFSDPKSGLIVNGWIMKKYSTPQKYFALLKMMK